MEQSTATSEVVRVSVPKAFEYVRLVRLTAAGFASAVGLDIEEIEDVRIAIDELTSLLVESGEGPTLDVEIRRFDDRLEFHGSCAGSTTPVVDALTDQIVGAVTLHHEVGCSGGTVWFRCASALPAP